MKNLLAIALVAVAPLAAHGQGNVTTLAAADLAWADSAAAHSGRLTSHLADDVLLLFPGAPILRGRSGVAGALLSMRPLRWQMLRAAVSADGRAGATFGVIAVADSGRPELGRYIAFWRHDGLSWRVAALMHAVPAAPLTTPPGSSFRPDTVGTGVRGEVERADRAFAAHAAAASADVAFRAAAAPDAMMFGGAGELMVGPDEIGAAMAGPAAWAWRPVASGGSEDLAFTVGEAEITVPLASGGRVVHTKYLTVWQRQPDGSWKFLTDGGNGRPGR